MALLLGALLTGCSPDEPFERLDHDRPASAEAASAADAFAVMLGELETQVGSPAAGAAQQDARSTVAALAGTEMELGNQARAFFEGHASQVERDTRATALSGVDVTVVGVTEADDQDGSVSLVTVETVRAPVDGPATTTRASYALSWGAPQSPASGATTPEADDAHPGAAQDSTSPAAVDPDHGPSPADPGGRLRLEQVRAVHDDDGHHALVDPASGTSTLGVAGDYVTALRSGSDRDVDALEGGVRSSADLRDAMRARLTTSGRMTPVEVPCGRTGTVQVVYVVLDGDVPPLRLEVDVSGESPVVNAYL